MADETDSTPSGLVQAADNASEAYFEGVFGAIDSFGAWVGYDPALAARLYGWTHDLTPEQAAQLVELERNGARGQAWEQTKADIRTMLAVGGGIGLTVALGFLAVWAFELHTANKLAGAAAGVGAGA